MKKNIFSETRVILLSGEEFQRLERLSEILKTVVDDATRDFNLDIFHILKPDDFSREKFSELVMTFPMMAEKRVIVIRNFDKLNKDVRKKTSEIIFHTPETTIVIVEGEKANLSPAPKDYFQSESFKPVYENKLPLWIKERFGKRGKKISNAAIALLINNAGSVLFDLNNEIEKAVIIAGDNEYVTDENVKLVVGPFKRDTIWGLCNALGINDFKESSNILANLMETGKDRDDRKITETGIIFSLYSHIMKIAEYNRLIKNGVPHNEAMKTVTPSEFLWKLNKMGAQTRNLDPVKIRRALTVLGSIESKLKSSNIDKKLLLDFLIPLIMPKQTNTRIKSNIY